MYGFPGWWRRTIKAIKTENIEFRQVAGREEKVLTCNLELTNKFFTRKCRGTIDINNLRIYNKEGIPLILRDGELYGQDLKEGEMLSAYCSTISDILEDNLCHIETSSKLIVVSKTKYLLGLLEFKKERKNDPEALGRGLKKILECIEKRTLKAYLDNVENCNTAEQLFSDSLRKVPLHLHITL